MRPTRYRPAPTTHEHLIITYTKTTKSNFRLIQSCHSSLHHELYNNSYTTQQRSCNVRGDCRAILHHCRVPYDCFLITHRAMKLDCIAKPLNSVYIYIVYHFTSHIVAGAYYTIHCSGDCEGVIPHPSVLHCGWFGPLLDTISKSYILQSRCYFSIDLSSSVDCDAVHV